jgi:hypothetical protein
MITAHDIETIKTAILKNVPADEKALAISMLNVGLHAINQFERIAASFERMALAMEKISDESE